MAFCALVVCSFLTGIGGNGGLASAMNATAKSFPDGAVSSSLFIFYLYSTKLFDW